VDALPAHAGALIQRVGGAGAAAGLHDDLRALAEIHHAVSALADEQAAIHGAAVLTALAGIDGVALRRCHLGVQHQLGGGVADDLAAAAADHHIAACQRIGCHGAALEAHLRGAHRVALHLQAADIAGQILTAVDLGLRGLHKAHTVQLADLAGEQLRGGGVLMGGDPCLVLAQVEGHTGVDDAHILAVKGGRVHLLQLGRGLGHQLTGHAAVLVQCRAAGDLRLGAVGAQLGRIDHLLALLDLVSGHGVQGQAHVAAVTVGDLQHHVVDGRQIQHVGHGGVVAVLRQLLGDVADGDAAAIGGHALGQGLERLVKGAELTPLHRLAAAGRQTLGGRELVVYQLRLGVLQQLHAVIGLHFRAQTARGLGIGLRKHLQIHLHIPFSLPFFTVLLFPVRPA
jgi:hypothetical protein